MRSLSSRGLAVDFFPSRRPSNASGARRLASFVVPFLTEKARRHRPTQKARSRDRRNETTRTRTRTLTIFFCRSQTKRASRPAGGGDHSRQANSNVTNFVVGPAYSLFLFGTKKTERFFRIEKNVCVNNKNSTLQLPRPIYLVRRKSPSLRTSLLSCFRPQTAHAFLPQTFARRCQDFALKRRGPSRGGGGVSAVVVVHDKLQRLAFPIGHFTSRA